MQKNFRGRLFRMFAINVTWLVRGVINIAKKWADEFTQAKVHCLGGDFQRHLLEIIDEQNLEAKFGGKLSNKVSDFFPPELI